MAKSSSRNDNYDIETVALNCCLYQLHIIHIADYEINELFDLKSLNTLFAELEVFLDTRAAKMFKNLGYTNLRRFNILKYP